MQLGSLTRGFSHYFLATILTFVLGILANIVLARGLGPELKGTFTLFRTTVEILSVFVGLSFASGICYAVSSCNLDRRHMVKIACVTATGQTSLALGLLLLGVLLGPLQAFWPQEIGGWIWLAAVLAIFNAISIDYLNAILKGAQRVVEAGYVSMTGRLIMVALSFGLVGYASWSSTSLRLEHIICMSLVSGLLGQALYVWLLWKPLGLSRSDPTDPTGQTQSAALPQAVSRTNLKLVVSYSLPCFAYNFSQALNYKLDIFVIGYFLSPAEVGWYTVAVGVGQMLWMISRSIGQVLFPAIAKDGDSKPARETTACLMRISLLSTTSCALGLGLLAHILLPLAYGEAYRPAVEPLLFLLPGIALFSPTQAIWAYFAGIGQPRLNLYTTCPGLCATLILDLLLIPAYGMRGAAIASSISYSCVFFVALYLFVRKTELPMRDLFLPVAHDFQLLMAGFRPRTATL